MTVTRLAYNCPPDSLGEVPQEEFVDAFENEITAIPLLQSADVMVTFNPGLAGQAYSISFTGDYTLADYDRVCELSKEAGERAWRHCINQTI